MVENRLKSTKMTMMLVSKKVVKSQIQWVSPYHGTRKIHLIMAPAKDPLSRHYSKYKCRDKGSHFGGVRDLCLKFCNFTTTKKLRLLPVIISNFGLSMLHSSGQSRFSSQCLNTDNFVPSPHRKPFRQLAGQ